MIDPKETDEFAQAARLGRRAKEQADAITGEISDQQLANEATEALAALRAAVNETEASRKALKKPFDEAGKQVHVAFKELASPLEAAKESLEARFLAFEKRKEDEARQRREAEEASVRRAQEEENARAAEQGRQSHHIAPPPPRREVKGGRGVSGAKSSPVSELKYDIVDEDALPDEYVERVPRRAKILADVRAGLVIPGVRPYRDRKVRVR